MIQSLLFPVDFSPASMAMAGFVKRVAAMFRADVTLLHVCDLSSHSGFELYARSPSEIADDLRKVAAGRLNTFLLGEFPAGKCSRLLFSGDAAARIVKCACDGRFDLIVMPTHAGNFRRVFLGSTTAKVISEVDCPVLTTQHAETIVPQPLEHRVWACALSLKPDSERVLRRASQEAAAVGAKLLLIHSLEGGKAGAKSEPGSAIERHDPREQEARQRLDELQRAAGSNAEVEIVAGPTPESLLTATLRSAANVLIIGRNLRECADGRLRGLAYDLIRDAPCPVLSV
jgi:nucleotide-binding universal stress UspA family protein